MDCRLLGRRGLATMGDGSMHWERVRKEQFHREDRPQRRKRQNIVGSGNMRGTEDGYISEAKFDLPLDFAMDDSFMYVSDTYNGTIRRVSLVRSWSKVYRSVPSSNFLQRINPHFPRRWEIRYSQWWSYGGDGESTNRSTDRYPIYRLSAPYGGRNVSCITTAFREIKISYFHLQIFSLILPLHSIGNGTKVMASFGSAPHPPFVEGMEAMSYSRDAISSPRSTDQVTRVKYYSGYHPRVSFFPQSLRLPTGSFF